MIHKAVGDALAKLRVFFMLDQILVLSLRYNFLRDGGNMKPSHIDTINFS